MEPLFMVVDVKTTEADVIACYVSLLADVIANVTVADVMTTYNIKADVIACYIYYYWLMLLPIYCGNNINHSRTTHPTVAIPSATWQ